MIEPQAASCLSEAQDGRTNMFFPLFRGSKQFVVSIAGLLIVLIAATDWLTDDNIPLGFLYLIPMLMLGRVLKPWQTLIVASLCTVVAELFDPFTWNIRAGVPRDTLYFAAFFAVGIFVYTANRNRQIILEQLREIEQERDARQTAEEQLRVLIETTPAAVLTTGPDGGILMANAAAVRLLGSSTTIVGVALTRFFPALAHILKTVSTGRVFRSVMQARGYRVDGETFLAEVCFSTYGTQSGARLAAVILDLSEDLRSREETSLHQMLAGSRLAVAAVSHEIRNVCGAIGVVHHNLARVPTLQGSKDFEALGSLIVALEQIASVDLRQYPDTKCRVDVLAVLDDLRIIVNPALQENRIQAVWQIEPELPLVWADGPGLLQILLNLANNSVRALAASDGERVLTISAHVSCPLLLLEFRDNGGGVEHPEELFRPFQAGAHATGLGLYLSRAFARAFGGDLRYQPAAGVASFVVELPLVYAAAEASR